MSDTILPLKGGVASTDPRLDRIPEFDEKSRGFQVRELLTVAPRVVARRRRYINPGSTLNQYRQGGCSGFSPAHAMSSNPFKVSVTNETAIQWYFSNQQLDEWPGGEYPGASPEYSGSSVLASMKTLLQLGHITQYRWIGAGSQLLMDDLRDTLKYVGPVCLGTDWYDSMFDPQPNGLLEVDMSSDPAGGHAYCAHDWVEKKLPGTPKTREYVVIQNSWGPGWGVTRPLAEGGFAYIPVEDLEHLLESGGEGAVPLRVAA